MSDEKKPFAAAVEDERNVFRLWLDGELQGAVLLDYSQAQAMTAALNSRVEAREQKLVAIVLVAAADIAREAYEYHNRPEVEQRDGFGDGARGVALRIAERLMKLNPRTADYVPAAEHEAVKVERDAMREHIKGTWGVALERLSETERFDGLAVALCTELGLKPEQWSDEMLGRCVGLVDAEFARRRQAQQEEKQKRMRGPHLYSAFPGPLGGEFCGECGAREEDVRHHSPGSTIPPRPFAVNNGHVRGPHGAPCAQCETHIFAADYEVSTPGNVVMYSGRSLCGRELNIGDHWQAVTQATFRIHPDRGGHCAACVAALDPIAPAHQPAP